MNDWYDAEQRVEKAQELFEQRKWQEALQELRAAIAINPFNSAWQFNIGLTLDELHRYDEAAEAYQRSLSLSPDDVEAHYHLGVDQLRIGQHAESLATFNRIEGLDPSYEPAYCQRILAHSEL